MILATIIGVAEPVTVAQLLDGRMLLDAHQAVAVVRETFRAARSHTQLHDACADPSLIDIQPSGRIDVRSNAAAPASRDWPVTELGNLLERLLAASVPGNGATLPNRLRFVVMRATGHAFNQPHHPINPEVFLPFQSAHDFLEALARFPVEDDAAHVREAYERWIEWSTARPEELDAPVRDAPIVPRTPRPIISRVSAPAHVTLAPRRRIGSKIGAAAALVALALVAFVVGRYTPAVRDQRTTTAERPHEPAPAATESAVRPTATSGVKSSAGTPSVNAPPTPVPVRLQEAPDPESEIRRLRAQVAANTRAIASLEDERVQLDDRLGVASSSDEEETIQNQIDRVETRIETLHRNNGRIAARLKALASPR